jgi:hypothetical protein
LRVSPVLCRPLWQAFIKTKGAARSTPSATASPTRSSADR